MTSQAQNYANEFADIATICDKRVFNARIKQLILAATAKADAHSGASSFRAPQRWVLSVTDMQRGRLRMLELFREPHNLSVVAFAALAGKSRQQVYKDIEAGRLLALTIGSRGQRIPDWQLDEAKKAVTHAVLARAIDIDPWTLYDALTQPNGALGDCVPIAVVNPSNRALVFKAVLKRLGIGKSNRAQSASLRLPPR